MARNLKGQRPFGGSSVLGTSCYRQGPLGLTPPREEPMSMAVAHGPIARGETVKFNGDACGVDVRIRPTHFIYTGHKDLWLLSRSRLILSSRGLFLGDVHLDGFRPGTPCEVNWGVLWTRDLSFTVEHRTQIKNAPPAQFIARIAGYQIF